MTLENIDSLMRNLSLIVKDCSDSDDLLLLSLFSQFLIRKRNILILKDKLK